MSQSFIKKFNTDIKKYLIDCFFEDICQDRTPNSQKLNEANKHLIAQKDFDLVSIAMSYIAIANYSEGVGYYKTLHLLNDAKYLANSTNSLLAQKINLFCSGLVEYWEKNVNFALDLIKASLCIKIEEKNFDDSIRKYKEKIEQEKNKDPNITTPEIKDETLLAFLEVGKSIALETNLDNLLTTTARQIQHALQADRCTVFLYDKEKNELWSKIALGLGMQEIRFDADKGLAGHVLKSGETININNAYESEYFNKEIDLKTGYKTKNILCMPIRNLSHQILGVFQVLNKIEGDFTKKDEDLLVAIGSSAGIAIENASLFTEQKKLIDDQKNLFSSFIDTLSASIDARDKITSGHSKRVTTYAVLICDMIHMSEKEKEVIKNASLLHDIGKIGIKDSVLQKEGKLTPQEYEHIKQHVLFTHNILKNVYLSKDFKEVADIASSHHERFDGTGYFKGLKGEEIPLGGRILAICDVFDAITSKRHYRNKMEIKDVLKIIIDGKNSHFDENMVNAFLKIDAYDILKVINDYHFNPDKKDETLLKEFNLGDLYGILTNEQNISKNQKKYIDTFNKYYHYSCEG